MLCSWIGGGGIGQSDKTAIGAVVPVAPERHAEQFLSATEVGEGAATAPSDRHERAGGEHCLRV